MKKTALLCALLGINLLVTPVFAAQQEASTTTETDDFDVSIGALYRNNTLTYGSVSVPLPGYSLFTPEDDSSSDYLINGENTAYVYVRKMLEFSLSLDSSTEESMLESYTDNGDWANVQMQFFEKYQLGEDYCIHYGLTGTFAGNEEYATELIVLPSETASSSLRFIAECTTQEAFDQVKESFDQAVINEDLTVYENREMVGNSKITVDESAVPTPTTTDKNSDPDGTAPADDKDYYFPSYSELPMIANAWEYVINQGLKITQIIVFMNTEQNYAGISTYIKKANGRVEFSVRAGDCVADGNHYTVTDKNGKQFQFSVELDGGEKRFTLPEDIWKKSIKMKPVEPQYADNIIHNLCDINEA